MGERERVRVFICGLGSVFGRMDFPQISIFGLPDFFADFVAQVFLLNFVGKSSATKMTGRPGHWSELGEYNILFLGSMLVISSQDSPDLGIEDSQAHCNGQT